MLVATLRKWRGDGPGSPKDHTKTIADHLEVCVCGGGGGVRTLWRGGGGRTNGVAAVLRGLLLGSSSVAGGGGGTALPLKKERAGGGGGACRTQVAPGPRGKGGGGKGVRNAPLLIHSPRGLYEKGREGGGGVWDRKVCVPTTARPDFPDGQFRCFPRKSLWSGGRGGGVQGGN